MPCSAGGLLVLAHLGRTWLQEHGTAGVKEQPEKKFTELVAGQMVLSERFLGSSTPDGRVLAATHQRNRPVRGWVQGSRRGVRSARPTQVLGA